MVDYAVNSTRWTRHDDQVLRLLKVPFYGKCLKKIGEMIYMDNDATYHMSKYIKKIYAKIELLNMIWPAQSQDLNPIENLWRIIKIRISGYRHQIHLVKDLRNAISEE